MALLVTVVVTPAVSWMVTLGVNRPGAANVCEPDASNESAFVPSMAATVCTCLSIGASLSRRTQRTHPSRMRASCWSMNASASYVDEYGFIISERTS